jgi:hypothetical protein
MLWYSDVKAAVHFPLRGENRQATDQKIIDILLTSVDSLSTDEVCIFFNQTIFTFHWLSADELLLWICLNRMNQKVSQTHTVKVVYKSEFRSSLAQVDVQKQASRGNVDGFLIHVGVTANSAGA